MATVPSDCTMHTMLEKMEINLHFRQTPNRNKERKLMAPRKLLAETVGGMLPLTSGFF